MAGAERARRRVPGSEMRREARSPMGEDPVGHCHDGLLLRGAEASEDIREWDDVNRIPLNALMGSQGGGGEAGEEATATSRGKGGSVSPHCEPGTLQTIFSVFIHFS